MRKVVLTTLYVAFSAMITLTAQAQTAFDTIIHNRDIAASNYYVYSAPTKALTPPPAGKQPFYISHYGRHGSRYLNNRKGYEIPYRILHQGDSLGKLTPLGKEMMQQIRTLIEEAEGRWGDLTELGRQQHRDIARRMIERFPEVFADSAHVDARSTIVVRCILSMASAMAELAAANPKLKIDMDASQHDMWYMNYQDKALRDSMMTPGTKKAYDAFIDPLIHNKRVPALLFNDADYIREKVSDHWLSYYLLKSGLMMQNTHDIDHNPLVELFTLEEIYNFWKEENAWWYFMYGPSLLNGGKQPYTQRNLLRQIIHETDSCLQMEKPGATLRYGHETIVLPLACLLDLNGYGYQTLDLEEIEAHGWWACLVFPMAANIQFVFYRENLHDKDVLFKVLLNESEATLPLPTDCAPYYHWNDFREYYLDKINSYQEP